MKVKILHISDLHFKTQNISQDIVIDSLLKKIQDICRKEEKPNVLIITGDITHAGKSEQYAKAKVFIDQVIRTCDIANERIFIIPGNHDVDRDKISKPYIRWWYKFNSEETLMDVLTEDVSFSKIKATTDAYYEFVKPYINGIDLGRYGEYVTEIQGEGGLPLKIVGLNSALFCGYDGDDNRQLALGLPQVHGCYNNIKSDSEIVISLVHHPKQCFHQCEDATLNTVYRGSDVVLSGHVHDPSNTIHEGGNNGKTIFVAAGAGYETRLTENGFNIIEICTNTLNGKVILYKYLHKDHLWNLNKDINIATDGVFCFQLKANHIPPSQVPENQKRYLNKVTSLIAKSLHWKDNGELKNELLHFFEKSFEYSINYLEVMSQKRLIIPSPYADGLWGSFIESINKIYSNGEDSTQLRVVSYNDIDYWKQAMNNENSDARKYCEVLKSFNGKRTRIWILKRETFEGRRSSTIKDIVAFMKRMGFDVYKCYEEDARFVIEKDFSIIGDICISRWDNKPDGNRDLIESFDRSDFTAREEDWKRMKNLPTTTKI